MGPFLFLVYANDLSSSVNKNDHIILFADDTSILCKGRTREDLVDSAIVAMGNVLDWFSANNLSFNAEKTKAIEFSLTNTGL